MKAYNLWLGRNLDPGGGVHVVTQGLNKEEFGILYKRQGELRRVLRIMHVRTHEIHIP